MKDDVAIRPVQPGDLQRLQEIREAAFKPVFQSFRDIVGQEIAATAFASAEDEQAALLESLCKPDSNHEVFVALLGTDIVGFVSISLDRPKRIGEIGLNAVHPAHAGQGIGTQLFDFALDIMREAGMAVATVGTGADPGHVPARRAYEKAGLGTGIPSVWLYKLL